MRFRDLHWIPFIYPFFSCPLAKYTCLISILNYYYPWLISILNYYLHILYCLIHTDSTCYIMLQYVIQCFSISEALYNYIIIKLYKYNCIEMIEYTLYSLLSTFSFVNLTLHGEYHLLPSSAIHVDKVRSFTHTHKHSVPDSATKYEACLLERNGQSLTENRIAIVFDVIDKIVPHLGVFSRVTKMCRKELYG